MKISDSVAVIFLATILVLAPASLFAQPGETGVGQVAGYVGGMSGLGSHAAVGASTGFAFWRYGLVRLDASFSPLGSETVRVQPASAGISNSRLYDFNLGLDLRLPVRGRWEPYGILAAGLLYNTYTRTPVEANAKISHRGDTNFAFHTGAGLRYYLRDNFGVRPEFKVIVSRQTYTRFTVGFFYVFPEMP